MQLIHSIIYMLIFSIIIIIIIINVIIKKSRSYKAVRERLTSYKSEDPNLTIPKIEWKKEKRVEDKKGRSNEAA